MKMVSFILAFCLWTYILNGMEIAAPRIAILDTCAKDKYAYNNFLALLKRAGFETTYLDFYSFLQNPNLQSFDAAILILTPDFFYNQDCLLLKEYMQALKNFYASSGKNLMILCPSEPKKTNVDHLKTLLNYLEVKYEKLMDSVALETIFEFMINVRSLKGSHVNTNLVAKSPKGASLNFETFKKYMTPSNDHNKTCMLLPSKKNCCPLLAKTWPSLFLIKNKKKDTICAIGNTSDFLFAEIEEDLFRCPLENPDRVDLFNNAYQVLKEFHALCTHKPESESIFFENVGIEFMRKTPESLRKPNYEYLGEKLALLKKEKIRCAWLTPDDLFLKEDAQLKRLHPDLREKLQNRALDRVCDLIMKAQFNVLWFECNAETYFSKNAIYKNEVTQFVSRIKKMAQALKDACKKNNRAMPLILIGTDLTTNFKKAVVKHPVQDFFDADLSKIPSPFDMQNFWQPELIEPFAEFIKRFKDDLPIDGIFLDFEMYHAQNQASGYDQLMDFSPWAWTIFRSTKVANDIPLPCMDLNDRINYLKKNKLFKKYFAILDDQMKRVANEIGVQLEKIRPDLIIGAYLPTLTTTSFYCALLSQLSRNKPILLATFNTDVEQHKAFLRQNNINCLHLSAVLLSKLKEKKDFDIIEKHNRNHDGVWFNRVSRMAYTNYFDQQEIEKNWWSVEHSPMSAEDLGLEINRAFARGSFALTLKNAL